MKKLVIVMVALFAAANCWGMDNNLYSTVGTPGEADRKISDFEKSISQYLKNLSAYKRDIQNYNSLMKNADIKKKVELLTTLRDLELLQCSDRNSLTAAKDKIAALERIKGVLKDKEYLENKLAELGQEELVVALHKQERAKAKGSVWSYIKSFFSRRPQVPQEPEVVVEN